MCKYYSIIFHFINKSNINTRYTFRPGLQDSNATQFTAIDDTCIASLDQVSHTSIDYLEKISKQTITPFKCLGFESFSPLSETSESVEQTFEGGFYISPHELNTQIHFDITMYYLFIRKYGVARKHVLICKENFQALLKEYKCPEDAEPSFKYCTVTKKDLAGYIIYKYIFVYFY